MLTRDQILAAEDRPREEVAVPEWGGSVYVSVMSGRDRDYWEVRLLGMQSTRIADVRALLAILTVTDAEGNRLFSLDDLEALTAKSGAALTRIYPVAMRLNLLGAEDVAELTEKKTIGAGFGST